MIDFFDHIESWLIHFLFFTNQKSRQAVCYGETWKHPIPFRQYVETIYAIYQDI